MTIINISEAKPDLSQLIDRVLQGEKIVIAKNNIPLVDLTPHKPKPHQKRQLGLAKGLANIPDDF